MNPNTGEPMGRHTRQVTAEQMVYLDAAHPSRIVLPVIPGVKVTTPLPACPALRGQPCREYQPEGS